MVELRRSRRLAGLEPAPLPESNAGVFVIHRNVLPQPNIGMCHRALGIVGSFLATLTLARAVVAVSCSPGYCLF